MNKSKYERKALKASVGDEIWPLADVFRKWRGEDTPICLGLETGGNVSNF